MSCQDSHRKISIAAVLLGILTVSPSSAQVTCVDRLGNPGTCIDIRQCPSALNNLVNNIAFPVWCGPKRGRFPSVCCANGKGTEPPSPNLDILEPAANYVCGNTNAIPDFDVRIQSAPAPSRTEVSENRDFEITVVGGSPALRQAWPWMALIGSVDRTNDIEWFCGGSLINDQWIITAAHCFDVKAATIVRLGEHDFTNPNDGAPHEDIGVESSVIYPSYSFPQIYHDLALLKLKRRVKFKTAIQPLCLPWGNEASRKIEGDLVTLMGWGHTIYGGKFSPVLQQTQVTVFPSSRCDASYRTGVSNFQTTWPNGIGEETICAGHTEGGRDACQGDSGGPIISRDTSSRYTLAGIVSTGNGCGSPDFPGIYTNMRRPEYLAWVKQVAF